MIRPEEIKRFYPLLATRRYLRNPNTIKGDSIVNKYLAPINVPDDLHPFAYIFKNALIEISRLSNYNIKTDFITQLNLIVLACTNTKNLPGGIDVEIILFKSPVVGDINYDPNRVFNVIKRDNYYTEEQYLQWLDFDEICIAFLNGTPYFITRSFLQSVMDLKPSQTFENYFNKIGVKYTKETTYNTGVVFFNKISNTMKDFVFDRVDGKVFNCIKTLNNNKPLPLVMNDFVSVNMIIKNGKFFLEVTRYAMGGNTSQYGVTGLLDNLVINNSKKEYIQIDPITANTLISYFYQEEDRFIEEGEDFLYHILAYYPQMTDEDRMQKLANNRINR